MILHYQHFIQLIIFIHIYSLFIYLSCVVFGLYLSEKIYNKSLFLFFRLVSSLTEYSLDSPQLTRHLTENFFRNYFYTHLIQVISFIIALPMVYTYE
jgi:hypothetical protein